MDGAEHVGAVYIVQVMGLSGLLWGMSICRRGGQIKVVCKCDDLTQSGIAILQLVPLNYFYL